MDQHVANILEESLKLPPEARAAIAGSLLDSLDDTVDEGAEADWEAEVIARLRDLNQGKAKAVPWAEVRRRIGAE